MTEAERAAAIAKLETTRDAFNQAVTGLSESQARYKPNPTRWSIKEIVEHVAVAEHGMYRFISDLYERTNDPHEAESAAALARTGDRKNMPLESPERARPKQRFAGLDEALKQFLDNRARTIEFVKTCDDDLRLRLIQHPAGLLNGRDCLKILTFHPARHVEQIGELKADPEYPR